MSSYVQWLRNGLRSAAHSEEYRRRYENPKEDPYLILNNVRRESQWPRWITEEVVRYAWFQHAKRHPVVSLWPMWMKRRLEKYGPEWQSKTDTAADYLRWLRDPYHKPNSTFQGCVDNVHTRENALAILRCVPDEQRWPPWLTPALVKELWHSEGHRRQKKLHTWPVWMKKRYLQYYAEWLDDGAPPTTKNYSVYKDLFDADLRNSPGAVNFKLIQEHLRDRERWPHWARKHERQRGRWVPPNWRAQRIKPNC